MDKDYHTSVITSKFSDSARLSIEQHTDIAAKKLSEPDRHAYDVLVKQQDSERQAMLQRQAEWREENVEAAKWSTVHKRRDEAYPRLDPPTLNHASMESTARTDAELNVTRQELQEQRRMETRHFESRYSFLKPLMDAERAAETPDKGPEKNGPGKGDDGHGR